MTQVVLTEEQARLFRNATSLVLMCDPSGKVLGHAQPAVPLELLDPIDRQMVENHLRRKGRPLEKGYSGAHVRAMFDALEKEWQRTGGFDKAHMDTFLHQWRAENP